MSNFEAAQTLLDQVEEAIADGDLEGANIAIGDLKPLLANARAVELTSLKTRIDGLKLAVHRTRTAHKAQLKKVMNQNVAINQYQQIAGQA